MGNCSKSELRHNTYRDACLELRTVCKQFIPLPDLQGGNGFPFSANGDFIKVVMKRKRPMLTVRNLHALYTIESKHILLPKRMVETQHSVVFFYTMCEMDMIEYLNTANINPNQRNRIIYSINEAVRWMHINSFVHRDIKLDNILLRNGRAVLCDLDQATPIHVVAKCCGTPTYMPPKTIYKKLYEHYDVEVANVWIDCYALGKTIAQMLYRENHLELLNFWKYWIFASNKSMPPIDKSMLLNLSVVWNVVLKLCQDNENNIFTTKEFYDTSFFVHFYNKLY